MSLINKMLQDLEARQGVATGATAAVYQDLQPVGARTRMRGSQRRLLLFLGALAVGAAGYVVADRNGFVPPLSSTKPVAATSTHAVAPTVVAAAPAAAVPAPPPPAAIATPAAPPTSPRPPASNADDAQERPLPAAAAPTMSAPKPAAVKNAPATTGSRGRGEVRIVTAAKPSSVPVRQGERATRTRAARSSSASLAAAESVTLVDKKVRPFTAEEKAEASYRRAVHFLDQGRPADAEAALREALRAQPAHVKARELAAGLALQGGHWRDAQSLLEEGLRQVPSHYLFARLLARVYLDHGADAKALAVMEKAVSQGSDDPDFSSLLGLLYQRAGRHADAVKEYEHSLRLRPEDARTWLGFAISLEGVEEWGAAKNAYRRAVELGGLTPPLAKYAEQRLAALKNR